MSYVPKFAVGQVVTNAEIVGEFQCGNMGGMRRSKRKNSLIIISDHTKGLYEDKWFGDILHYTGMGKSGDQDLKFMQNKTLAQSNSNGVSVYLFEALLPLQYIYHGEVFLRGEPFQEVQPGEDGKARKVWMFPIKLQIENQPIENHLLENYKKTKQKKLRALSAEELKLRAEQNQSQRASSRNISSQTYIRDEFVAEYARRKANGICQLCGQPVPFLDKEGREYLESHHIVWLSQGGPDTIDNTVGICPNCHRKMHVLNLQNDINTLNQKIK